MTPIVSPTTNERIIRTFGLAALFGVFSGWFIYDGYVGYPEKNLEKAIESLDPVPDTLPPIDDAVTEAAAAVWVDRPSDSRHTRAEVVAAFGEPGWESADRNDIRYFGPGGMLAYTLRGDLVADVVYTAGDKNDTELVWQRYLGFGLLPVALGFVLQFVRVVTTRVELSDAGLNVRGRPVIPFDAMKSIEAKHYRKKGFVDLSYSQDGRNKTVRLDDYVIRDFRPMIETICERCHIDDPLPPPKKEED